MITPMFKSFKTTRRIHGIYNEPNEMYYIENSSERHFYQVIHPAGCTGFIVGYIEAKAAPSRFEVMKIVDGYNIDFVVTSIESDLSTMASYLLIIVDRGNKYLLRGAPFIFDEFIEML